MAKQRSNDGQRSTLAIALCIQFSGARIDNLSALTAQLYPILNLTAFFGPVEIVSAAEPYTITL